MKKIFVLNGAPKYLGAGGRFNKTVSEWTLDFFQEKGFETKYTDINEAYNLDEEVEKFVWSDFIIYHTSIWWFQLPHQFKKYIDDVLTQGSDNRIFHSDGRHFNDQKRNYGTGGSLQGRQYILTTTWNAPIEAFTLKDEFFQQCGVDKGVMFGFHKMNDFIGLDKLEGYHFYDVVKNPNLEFYKREYLQHLEKIIIQSFCCVKKPIKR